MDLPLADSDTRVICRRERPHPGAQQSLFDLEWGFRHQCFVTNGWGDVSRLEQRHRAHAHVEDHIRELKATGGENLPFSDVVSNMAWLTLVLIAQDLLAWSRNLLFTGSFKNAEVKRLRYALLHTAAASWERPARHPPTRAILALGERARRRVRSCRGHRDRLNALKPPEQRPHPGPTRPETADPWASPSATDQR